MSASVLGLDHLTDHLHRHARRVPLASEKTSDPPASGIGRERGHPGAARGSEATCRLELGFVVDLVERVSGDTLVDALGPQLGCQGAPGQSSLGEACPDQRLGVLDVVDQAHVFEAVEYLNSDVGGDVPVGESPSKTRTTLGGGSERAQQILAGPFAFRLRVGRSLS